MARTVLILGASGRFGRNAAIQFKARGWEVRLFDRATDDLERSAGGVSVIVNAWNPPYPDWARLVPDLHRQVITVAAKTGATVIVPGNVYVFGAQTPVPWGSNTSHRAENPLGQIRIHMENAYRQSGVRTIVLRAGDFIDTCASGNWFDQIMIKSLSRGRFIYPGNPDIPHAWAYLPDLAAAAVDLAEMRESLPVLADIPFPGYKFSGRDMAAALERLVSRPLKLKRMSWLPLLLARPFWPMARCLLEMRYLWDTPHWLDGAAFHRLLPDFQATPFELALASAIPPGSIEREVHPDQTVPARR
ncbi:epimerase [Sedimentitalea sp. JM2-8]|uniref:Epimerase n=1 Tax=Sedimentitalea xiamensis TaxID=3050037 RepID=A0ABT7FJC6_9RHOB|nr:epimerase [Sedimentitalea xiamensis]MDK3075178.1 epimerase [Sedimentitalea xiamensis]